MLKLHPKFKTFLKMTVALLVVAIASAYILAEVYQFTKEPIKQANNRRELAAIAEVVNEFDNDPFAEKMTIYTPDKKSKLQLYPARKDGIVNSFAIKTYTNNGFGGRIDLIVGFYIDGAVKGYKVISHQETPGLGSKITEPKFQNQFNGFDVSKHKFKVRQDGGDIDAVTAATISSRAVIDAIQRAVDAYKNFNTGK